MNQAKQAALPGIVVATLQAFDYANDGFATRWHPFGQDAPIVIDPTINAGAPTVHDRRLTVQAVYKRWKAGQSLTFLANDLKLTVDEAGSILRYADQVRLAA
jgi:uncharacterized protein (DUF433 family)